MPNRQLISVLPKHEAAELLRLMAEGIRECAVFLMDPHGVITMWNLGATEMKGYPADEVIGRFFGFLYTEDDQARGRPEHNLREAARAGYYREETWRQRKDGQLFWAHIALAALRDDAGVLLGFSKITLDLTPHKLLEQCRKEKQEIDFILRAAESGTWKWHPATGKVELSRHFLDLLGYAQHGACLDFHDWLDLIHPDQRAAMRTQLDAARAGADPAAPLEAELRLCRKDGRHHWFLVRANWRRERDDAEPVLIGAWVDIDHVKIAQQAKDQLLQQLQEERIRFANIREPMPSGVVLHDVSSLRQAQLSAATEKERLQVTLAAITDGVITTGLDGVITWLNPAAEHLTGLSQAQARGRPFTSALRFDEPDGAATVLEAIRRCLRERRVISDLPHATLSGAGGRRYGVESAVAPITLADGELIGAVLVLHDVTESKRLMRRLGFEASHDALTGLVNRREFETRLQRTLEYAKQTGGTGSALLYMDLDQFKIVNDTCGHAAGDDLLKMLAKLYSEHVRERDTLARLGGDEFALIVEHCTLQEASIVASKIVDATRAFRYACKNRLFQLGVSIGLTPIDSSLANSEEALRRADHACYIAKERGRNRVYVHDTSDLDFARRRSDMHWLTRLAHAFRNDHLQLYCQPIVALGDGDARQHYEILLRLKNGKRGPIGPGRFLPAAERYDVILDIDRWVLNKTLAWLESNPAHLAELEMCSINLSRRSLADHGFHSFAVERIDASKVPAEKLCFEISENGALADMQKTITFIESLAACGCRFSLDDFGTGMTSFSYLKQLPVDFIKIDGSFIQMMSTNEIDYEMVRFTNDISHMMGRKTIAEYVTDQHILQNLKQIGVDFAQGYWIGKPRPLII